MRHLRAAVVPARLRGRSADSPYRSTGRLIPHTSRPLPSVDFARTRESGRPSASDDPFRHRPGATARDCNRDQAGLHRSRTGAIASPRRQSPAPTSVRRLQRRGVPTDSTRAGGRLTRFCRAGRAPPKWWGSRAGPCDGCCTTALCPSPVSEDLRSPMSIRMFCRG
jgi:hypothetical protein